MDDRLARYIVVLNKGKLSPAEDLQRAIIAAAQVRAFGVSVERVERGTEPVLHGDDLRDALANWVLEREARRPPE